jgi:hypothetical protein
MRIGTWNVEYAYEGRLDILRRVMAVHSADIWVLTETHDDLVPEGALFCAHSEPRPRNFSGIREGSRWVSIWSKYPIIQSVTLPSADRKRTVAALLDIGHGKELIVYGTVMPWHTDQGDNPAEAKTANWSEHNRVVPLQCAEWAELQRLHPKAALCVAGDYNTDMGTGSRYGTKEGIAALIEGLCQCNLFCATGPGYIPAGKLPALPIDHISLPVAWAKSAAVVAAWPAFKAVISDHSGLIVEVKQSEGAVSVSHANSTE